MSLISGLTTNTAKHLQLDAGAFYKNFIPGTDTPASATSKLLGATAGGGSFSAVPTIRQIEVDGKKGAVKGFEALDEWVVTLTANVKEITPELMKIALAAGTLATTGTGLPTGYDKVAAGSELADADYLTNITWVGRISGSSTPIIIVVYNALATNGLTLTTADKAEGVIPVTFKGHYTIADLETPPFDIFYPQIS